MFARAVKEGPESGESRRFVEIIQSRLTHLCHAALEFVVMHNFNPEALASVGKPPFAPQSTEPPPELVHPHCAERRSARRPPICDWSDPQERHWPAARRRSRAKPNSGFPNRRSSARPRTQACTMEMGSDRKEMQGVAHGKCLQLTRRIQRQDVLQTKPPVFIQRKVSL
jgi:hypothetical protein